MPPSVFRNRLEVPPHGIGDRNSGGRASSPWRDTKTTTAIRTVSLVSTPKVLSRIVRTAPMTMPGCVPRHSEAEVERIAIAGKVIIRDCRGDLGRVGVGGGRTPSAREGIGGAGSLG